MTTELPYAPDVETGVFACRSEYRPNPIAVTTMMVLSVVIKKSPFKSAKHQWDISQTPQQHPPLPIYFPEAPHP